MQKDKEKLLVSLKTQGYSDEIIKAFARVNRELFVPDQFITYAYEDIAIPLEDGSTLSQPSTIALMLSLLEPEQNNKILEIGSGSGYVLALLSEIIKSGRIYGIEINPRLAVRSKKNLANDSNIEIINRSGLNGLNEQAPFDRILVSASFPDKEVAYRFLEQLKDPGILVCPVKDSIFQIKKSKARISEKTYKGYAFVPFVSKE